MRVGLTRPRKSGRARGLVLIIFFFVVGYFWQYVLASIIEQPIAEFQLRVSNLALSRDSAVSGESLVMPSAERAQTGFLYGYNAELDLEIESLAGEIKSGYFYYAPDNLRGENPDLEIKTKNFKELDLRKTGGLLLNKYRLKNNLTYVDNSPGAIKDLYFVFENEQQEVFVEVLLLKVEKQFDYILKDESFKLSNKKNQAEWQAQPNYQVYKLVTKNDFFNGESQELTFLDDKNYTVDLAKYFEMAKLVKSHYLELK